MSILGSRVRRVEDPRFLRGEAMYVDDLDLPGALHAVFVRSPFAHARVGKIEGEGRVFTAADIDIDPVGLHFWIISRWNLTNAARVPQPVVARDVVRYVGEIVAIVVGETLAEAIDAAAAVVVDYEPLEAVVDPELALRDEVLLFPELGTNVCARWEPPEGEDPFAGCEVVVDGRVVSQRLAAVPLEGQAAAAKWEGDRLTAWLSTQAPHSAKQDLAGVLGLEPSQVRVIAPDVGGGFGPKAFISIEYILIGWLARALGRPVRWTEMRSENLVALPHGRGQILEVRIGGDRDGVIGAYRLRVLQDAGGYPKFGAILPHQTRLLASGVYDIPRVIYEARSVVTNTTPTGAYRGAGRPETIQAIEHAIDRFALETGLDPAEVRRRNLIAPDAFPFTTPTGAVYDSGDYEGALDLLLTEGGYEELRAEQRRRRETGDLRELGIGLALYVEVSGPTIGPEWAEVEIAPGGGAVVRSGLSPHGQGHVTSLKMLVAARLGIPIEASQVVHGDTDQVPRGIGTFASRSLQTGGSAVAGACTALIERAKELSAEILEASPPDMRFDVLRGRFHIVGSPEPSCSWAELVDHGQLRVDFDFDAPASTFPFGAHLAAVEVDTETGIVVVRKMVTIDDAGRILNPLIAEGQRHGGIAQGIAQALFEQVAYDEYGNPLTGNLLQYKVPSAADLPSFDLLAMETPTPHNELGAKGIGEAATVGATPAVANAVLDALAPYRVTQLDMPFTPERVWRAIHRP
jgi:carbon-monoxide dehydrogenase large subunit